MRTDWKKYIIGIDPDVKESGFAFLDVEAGRFTYLRTLPFPALLDMLQNNLAMGIDEVKVVVEASQKIGTNWHLPRYCSAHKAAAMGEDVGRCHEVGVLIAEMARSYGYDVVEAYPLVKMWGMDKDGRPKKVSNDQMAQFVPDWPKRTNQEIRDAALLAWAHANLPIRIKRNK